LKSFFHPKHAALLSWHLSGTCRTSAIPADAVLTASGRSFASRVAPRTRPSNFGQRSLSPVRETTLFTFDSPPPTLTTITTAAPLIPSGATVLRSPQRRWRLEFGGSARFHNLSPAGAQKEELLRLGLPHPSNFRASPFNNFVFAVEGYEISSCGTLFPTVFHHGFRR
jgi:hypothetical protein